MEKQIEEIIKKAFLAGRNYQQGEYNEYNGGAENQYPDCGEYIKALSKAEDKGEEFETSYREVLSTIRTPIEEPTNSLDELERWVKAESEWINSPLNINARRTVDLILTKIQELKTITP